MGVPVLMSVPEGEATRLVRATGCGDRSPVRRTPRRWRTRSFAWSRIPTQRARFRASGLAAASEYTREKQAALMLHVLEAVSGKGRSPS